MRVDDETDVRADTGTRSTGWRPWLCLAVMASAVFMAALDMTILFLALPTIAADLAPSATQQLWVLHIGDIVGAGLVLTAGRLADRIGARRLFAVTVALYGASSVMAAFSSSIEMLIVARVLLGASMVAVGPASMIMIRHLFPDGRRFATAVGIFMAAFSGGMALGPPIGGLLLHSLPWGAVFLINVPIAVLALATTRLLPRIAARDAVRIDLPSVLLSIAAIAAFVWGVQTWAESGVGPVESTTVVAGLILGWLFVRRQRRLPDPLLDPGLFRSTRFTVAVLAIIGVVLADVGPTMQIAGHLQIVNGLPAREAGLALAVPAVAAVIGTAVAPQLTRWFSPATIMGVGALLAAGAAVVLVVVTGGGGSPVVLVGIVSVVEIGAAPVFGLGAGLIVASAPADQVGSATAVQDMAGSLSNALGLMIGGVVAFVVYQSTLASALPTELSADDGRAVQDSPGGALGVIDRLPTEIGDPLQRAVEASYADSTQALYVVAAVLFVAVGVLILLGLRGAEIESE